MTEADIQVIVQEVMRRMLAENASPDTAPILNGRATSSSNEQGSTVQKQLADSNTVTVTHEGFQTEKLPSILVQANRTASLNVSLKVGQVGTTIEVEAAPTMNAVDTTNGYVLEDQQIQAVPLPTGSFTGLA